jgi:hypothetical protein
MLDVGDACSAPHATVAKHHDHTRRLNNRLHGRLRSGSKCLLLADFVEKGGSCDSKIAVIQSV